MSKDRNVEPQKTVNGVVGNHRICFHHRLQLGLRLFVNGEAAGNDESGWLNSSIILVVPTALLITTGTLNRRIIRVFPGRYSFPQICRYGYYSPSYPD